MIVASMDPEYRYDPLEADTKRIRLLRLIQDDGPESNPTPKFDLESFSLDSDTIPRFYAISYFWGDPKATAIVRVGGKQLQVPKNTEAALRALLCHDTSLRADMKSDATEVPPPCAWIDAVCINQLDASERAKQVTLMGTIYSRADEVLIWLGDTDDRAAEAAVRQVHALFQTCMGRFYGGHLVDGLSDEDMRACEWDSIRPLYASPWWNRIWTIQEAFFARKATCMLQRCSIPFYELTLTAYAVSRRLYRSEPTMRQELAESLRLATARVNVNRLIPDLDEDLFIEREGSISTLLEGFYASDPRDMLYGVMGLLERLPRYKHSLQSITVNYATPFEELFAKVSLAFIRESSTLKPLQFAAVLRSPEPNGVPSWALDLSPYSSNVRSPHPFRPQVFFGLSFSQLSSTELEKSGSSIDWATIRLPGFILDEIETIISLEGVLPDRGNAKFWAKLDEIRLLVKQKFLQPEDDRSQESEKFFGDTASSVRHDLDPETAEIKAAVIETSSAYDPSALDPIEHHNVEGQAGESSSMHKGASIDKKPSKLAGAVARTLVAAIFAQTKEVEERNARILERIMGDFTNPVKRRMWVIRKSLDRAFPQTKRMQRAFFVTQRGRLGMALPKTQPGDKVCLLQGGEVPFILKKPAEQEHWNLVSDAYVHGVEECVSQLFSPSSDS